MGFAKSGRIRYFAFSIIIAAIIVVAAIYLVPLIRYTFLEGDELENVINEIFEARNKAILDKNEKSIEIYYDMSTRNGVWAFEYETKRMKYLHKWAEKQGVNFTDINSKVLIRRINENDDGYTVNVLASTEYNYFYVDSPEKNNMFRIGTYHSIRLSLKDEKWYITREWYTDPFADSLSLNDLKSEEIRSYILSSTERDFSNLNQRRIGAVEYADKYCGAASDGSTGYKYNRKYKDYNPQGGDCANFASQILYEGGKFKKTGAWNYGKGATRAWVSAQGFTDYMLGSGRASLIAYGTYNKVYKASYKLLPGDFVAYEKNGKIAHVSVVTGADSKGYSLVNCHNTDRYRVPWDLGWSDRGIKFFLVRVHY